MAAATGASLKELMARLGHSSTRAAMIHQHATQDRDEAFAKAAGWGARCIPTSRLQLTKHDYDRVARSWPGVSWQSRH